MIDSFLNFRKMRTTNSECGNSSVGRARPCQGRGREFEPRFPLQFARVVESVDTRDLKSLAFRGVPVQVWLRAPFQNHTSGSLAQSVEQRTFNPLVEGSNPSRPTNIKNLQRLKFYLAITQKILNILFIFYLK